MAKKSKKARVYSKNKPINKISKTEVKPLEYKTTAEIKVPANISDQILGQNEGLRIIKKAAKQRRNVLLIGEPGCLIGDERVFLGDGAIAKMEDFGNTHLQRIEKEVIIGDENETASANIFHKYQNQPLIEIITASGKSVKGTYNHPILVIEKLNGNLSRKWKRLDRIKKGDKVVVVNNIKCTINEYVKTNFSTIKRSNYGPKFKGKLPNTVTPNLAALLGYIIGDGWADTNRERIGFIVSEDEKEILQELISLVSDNFGIEPFFYKRIRKDRNMPVYYVEISNKDIYQNLIFLQEKRVPDLIFKSGNEVAASFLKWLFTADGTVYNKKIRGRRGIALKSKDIELLRDVQILLLRFGIFSNIATLNPKSNKDDIQLHIRRGYDIIKFHKKIGFACEKKIKVLDSLATDAISFARVKEQRSEKVVKIIKNGFADVFDIEVPNAHRFIANGIIVHNTGKSLLGQALAEQLPVTKLVDTLCFPNDQDENNPLVRVMARGKGKELVNRIKIQSLASSRNMNVLLFIVLIITLITPWWIRKQYGDIIAAASIIGSMIFLAAFVLFINLNKRLGNQKIKVPKLLVDNSEQKTAPFLDGTGAHAGALLGDVLHDPLQSLLDSNKIITTVETDSNQLQIKEEQISIIDEILKKYEREVIIKDNYKAVFLPKNEFAILGEKNNNIENSYVLSVNRYLREGELIKITTESGKELIITPEHKVAIKGFYNKIKYIEADKIKPWHKVITLAD